MRSAIVITCLAVFSEVIDGYLLTRPRDTIALLGDIVVLDCVTNTSRLLDWRLTRGGGIASEWISRDNIIRPNISDSFRILSKEVGQFALVVNPVIMSLAGRYECRDRDEEKPSSAEVTVLNGIPSCDEMELSHSLKIACSFGYAGNLTPQLEWMALGESSWNASCEASNVTVDCVFESSCSVNKLLPKPNTFLTICIGENNTCEWGKDLSSVGQLQLKGYNKTVGSWHCTSAGVQATTQQNSDGSREISLILLLIGVGVISTVIILLLFVLHKNYGICRKNRIPHDVLYSTTTDSEYPVQTQIETITAADGSVNMMSIYSLAGSTGEEDSPVYGQVKKKKAVLTKTAVNGHDNGIFENSIYGYAKPTGQVTTDNFETDGIIYAELSKVPRAANGRIQGAHVASSEGFDTSMYASIDHNLRAPPLLQQSQSHHRHPN